MGVKMCWIQIKVGLWSVNINGASLVLFRGNRAHPSNSIIVES